MAESVAREVVDAVATVTLNQPDRGNPLDVDAASDLGRHLDAAASDESVRAVLLRASGKNFSFGGDIKFMNAGADDLPGRLRQILDVLNPALLALSELDLPVVAAVRGWCVGGGLGLAGLADVIVASDSARFGAAFVGIGLSNDAGTTYSLASRVGIARARRFFLLDERWDAAQALEYGLADHVVPDAELDDAAHEVAVRLATGPTVAYGAIKRSFRRMSARDFADAARQESDGIAATSASDDAREAIAAKNEKRPATFRGR